MQFRALKSCFTRNGALKSPLLFGVFASVSALGTPSVFSQPQSAQKSVATSLEPGSASTETGCSALPKTNRKFPVLAFRGPSIPLFRASSDANHDSILDSSASSFSDGTSRGATSAGLTQAQYESVIQSMELVYEPIFRKHGKRLRIQRLWASADADIRATRDEDDNPVILTHGGLARHPLMSVDSFVMFHCHEMGHFLGGAPKKVRGPTQRPDWTSAEGQADYYASTKCAKEIWSNSKENDRVVAKFSADEIRDLEVACTDSSCSRIAYAGKVMAKIIADLTGKSQHIAVASPDFSLAPRTILHYPTPQCRLDTIVAGANCGVNPREPFDDLDPRVGACESDPKDSLRAGGRPGCWYRN